MTDKPILYASPDPSEAFTEYWETLIQDIQERPNIKKSHLEQLRLLCDALVEYDELKVFIRENGRTYEVTGRNGTQIKIRPEVTHMKSMMGEIRNYSRMLGLLLFKDTQTTNNGDRNAFE